VNDRSGAIDVSVGRALYVLAFLTLVNAFSNIDRFVFSLLLPLIKRDLGLSDAMLGLLSGAAFAISYSVLSLPFAFLADRWNRKRLIAIGFATWSAVTALTGATVSASQLGAARFVLGAAEATSLAPSTSILADLFGLRRRVLALGVLGTSHSIGLLVSFPIVGLLAERFGWRTVFVAVGIPGVIAALVFQLTVDEPRRPMAEGARGPRPAGVGATLKFLFGSRAYVLLLAGGALSAFNLGAFIAWTPTFLMRVHQLNPAQVGALVGLARGPAGILGSLGAGLLVSRLARSDLRWHARIPGIAMMLLCPVDLLLLLSPQPSMWALALMCDAFLVASIVGPCFAIASSVAPPRMRSVAAALYLVFASVTGQSLGPFFIGWLNDRLLPQLGAQAVRFSLAAAVVTALCGGVAYWLAGAFLTADTRRALEALPLAEPVGAI
jgi:MFS family permease